MGPEVKWARTERGFWVDRDRIVLYCTGGKKVVTWITYMKSLLSAKLKLASVPLPGSSKTSNFTER